MKGENHWSLHPNGWWERTDGASVWRNRDDYWARPWLEGHRAWSANHPPSSPNASGALFVFHRRNSRFGIIRRWKTPEAAMRAVDREVPIK